jgi:putative ABC transport system permease protein
VIRTEITETFRLALRGVLVHKTRSGLSILGILIGVFSIIVVMTSLRILKNGIQSGMTELGLNTFRISKFPQSWTKNSAGYANRRDLTYDQMVDLKAAARTPEAVGISLTFSTGEVHIGSRHTDIDVQLIGVTPETFETMNWVIAEGRAIRQFDLDFNHYNCILGSAVAKRLFDGSPLGQSVYVAGLRFSVIGVLQPKGNLFGASQDNIVLFPITTGFRNFGSKNAVSAQVQAPNQQNYQETIEETRAILRKIRQVPLGEPDDFELISNDATIMSFQQFTSTVTLGAAAVSSIALLAAGFGIMNIMLVAVTERTREIGVYRAIGAKKRVVLAQFTMEAIVLCYIGGVLGVVLGVASGNIVAIVLKVPPVIPYDWMAIGLSVCTLVGLVFGIYPAYRATQVNPIESLRHA